MRAALLTLLLSLCACRQPGAFIVLTVERGAGVSDGIVSLDLTLDLGGRSAAARFDTGGAELTLPNDLVLDVGSGAGALTVTADATGAGGQRLAQGMVRAEVIRGQTVRATLVLHPPGRLVADRSDYDFGVITQGATLGPVTFTVTNSGGQPTGALQRQAEGDSGAFQVSGCEGQALAAGAKCELQVTYKPTLAGSHQLTLTVSGSPGGSASIKVTGTAVAPSAIKIAPAQKDYGPVLVGVTVSQIFTVTNSGNEVTGSLSTDVTGSDAGQFVKSGDGCAGQTLAPQGSCIVTVTFTPAGSTGDRAASLTVSATPGGIAPAPLVGRALTPASIAFNVPSHDFGTVDVGQTTTPVTFTVENSGGQSTGMLSTSLSGASTHFVVDMNACTGQVLPYLGTCTVRGHFAPQSFGPKSLTLTVSGTPGGDAAIVWNGVGHDQVTLTVSQPFSGDGMGSVTGPGINCPSGVCSVVIDRSGASPPQVTLTATPASLASFFNGWSGDCAGANPCNLVMDASKSARPTFDRQRYPLQVTLNNTAGASGTVTSTTVPAESGEIDCGTTCNLQRYYNASVTLTAAPAAGFYFGGWSGDCTGTSRTCVVTMTAARSAEARFTPANRVFTTAAKFTLAQVQAQGTGADAGARMLSGADAICAAAGGAGMWRAFISRAGVHARDRIPATARGWVRPDGLPFADRLPLNGDPVFYPLVKNQTSGDVPPADLSWTGTLPDGTASMGDCNDWASTTGVFYHGFAGGGSGAWMFHFIGDAQCNASHHLICMQIDYFAVVTPPPPPASRRLLFLSSATFGGNSGLAAFDATCDSEATVHGLPVGSYKAFVASSGASAASRFTARGAAVVRPDGVVVASTDTSLFAANALLAAVNQRSNGSYNYFQSVFSGFPRAWIGANAANVPGGTGNTCYAAGSSTSWADNGAAGQVGDSTRISAWTNLSVDPCNGAAPVYCLEE